MILYFARGACSLAVRILMNELEIQSEYKSVDLQTKKTESGDDFYQINPKGYVPALDIGNNKVLAENALIHLYLAETKKATRLLPDPSDPQYYPIIEALIFVTTELHKSFGPLFNAKITQDLKNEIFIPHLKLRFGYVEKQLKTNKYLTGNAYTLPDGYLFVMLFWATRLKVDLSDLPNIQKYYNELKNRPSIKKSLEEENLS